MGFAPEEAQGAPKPAATADETADLAKATQNPVASLISVPFQNNFNFGIGPYRLSSRSILLGHAASDRAAVSQEAQTVIFQPWF